jgi:hypothetical protein
VPVAETGGELPDLGLAREQGGAKNVTNVILVCGVVHKVSSGQPAFLENTTGKSAMIFFSIKARQIHLWKQDRSYICDIPFSVENISFKIPRHSICSELPKRSLY